MLNFFRELQNLHNDLHERVLSDARWRQIQEDMDDSIGVKFIVM